MPLRSNSAGLADGNWPDLRDEVELRHLKLLEHEFGPYPLNESTWKNCSPMYAVADSTTPALILHGEGREPQSRASLVFFEAMRQHYKVAEYCAIQASGVALSSCHER